MRVTIRVDIDGMYSNVSAAIDVTDLQVKCFEPLKTGDDPIVAMTGGEVMQGSQKATEVIRTRLDAADDLAKVLADHIVTEMKKNDTHNGYDVAV